MRLFRSLGSIALCGLLATTLTACAANQQAAQTGSGVVPNGWSIPPKVTPDKGTCMGTNDVTVAPCPIKLTKDNYRGVIVTVSSPRVAAARLSDPGGCQAGICVISRPHGNPRTHFHVKSGTKCNVAHPVFSAYTASRHLIGTATLTVINKIDSETGERCR